MALICTVPSIFVAFFGGAIADRVKKKYILIISNTALTLVALGMALVLYTGRVSPEIFHSYWILIASAMLQNIIGAFSMTTLMAFVPETVRPNQLMNAVAFSNLTMNASILLVSALAGVAIDRLGFVITYLIASGSYIFSVMFYLLVPNTHKLVTIGRSLVLSHITEIFKYIRRNPKLLFVLLFMTIFVILATPYQQFLPVYAVDILNRGATGQGLLLSTAGAGALLGSIIVMALFSRKRGLILLGSGFLAGAALLVFAFSTNWALSLVMMVLVGITNSLRNTIGSTTLQSNTEPAFMGRISSFISIQFYLASIFTFLAGILMQVVKIQWVIGGLAIMLIAFTAFMLIFSHTLRRLD